MPGIDPVSATAEGLQAAAGLVQTISADKKIEKLLAQRKAYVTPDEVNKILQLALNNAPGDTITRDFQQGQLDRDFSQTLGVATSLGADPNDLSRLFEAKINGMMKVGQQFHASNLEAFSKVFDAFNLLASNKAAEQKSQQDIIKDQLQAAAASKAQGVQNIGNAVNSFIGTQSAAQTSDLYGAPAAQGTARDTAFGTP